MKNKHQIALIITIAGILLIFLGPYLSIFNSEFSGINSEWGDFGDYFAGTIGICFTLIGVAFMYLTFYEQRKQQFENGFQQYLSNYYSLLNLIKERWFHIELDWTGRPTYQTGREIFGNAVGYITIGDELKKFKEVFNVHINVFQHYCNYIIEFFTFLSKNRELKNSERDTYIDRFFSMMSVYELTFFAFYVEYMYKNDNRELLRMYLFRALSKIEMSESAYHRDQFNFIKKCTGLAAIIERVD